MDIETREKLKGYFRKGAYPTEQQFAALIESLVHKDDQIPQEKIEGLAKKLQQLVNQTADTRVEVLDVLDDTKREVLEKMDYVLGEYEQFVDRVDGLRENVYDDLDEMRSNVSHLDSMQQSMDERVRELGFDKADKLQDVIVNIPSGTYHYRLTIKDGRYYTVYNAQRLEVDAPTDLTFAHILLITGGEWRHLTSSMGVVYGDVIEPNGMYELSVLGGDIIVFDFGEGRA